MDKSTLTARLAEITERVRQLNEQRAAVIDEGHAVIEQLFGFLPDDELKDDEFSAWLTEAGMDEFDAIA